VELKGANSMTLSRVRDIYKERFCYSLAEVGTDFNVSVFDNTIDNLLCAFYQRVFLVKKAGGGYQPPPKPLRGAWQSRIGPVARRVINRMRAQAPVVGFQRLSFDAFADRYTGRKRAIYLEAAESLNRTPIRAKDAKIKAFMKGGEKTVIKEGK